MATTNGSLDPIYQRLNSVDRYHPFSSDTFHDWSMEAGDTINVSRDGSTIQSPVHTTMLTWKGQPKVTVSSEGSETRPSVTRQTKNKYGRGGSGLRNDMGMWRYMSDIYGALTSSLELTESRLWLEFQGRYDGLQSELEFTRSALRIEFRGLYDGLSSHFELTRSQMLVTFQGMYDGLSSEFLLTRSELRTEFRGLYDGLNSEFQITRSELRAEFEGLYDGLSSDFQLTRSQLRVEFEGLYDGLSSDFRLTRSELRTEFKGLYDGLSSDLTFTRSALQTEFRGLYDGLSSDFKLTRSELRTEFRGLYDGLSSDFRLTRSEMKVEFKGMYDGLSSSLEFTRSSLTTTIQSSYDGLSSRVTQTASSWSTRVSKIVDKDGNIKAAEITVAINNAGSEARINADKIYLLGQTIANQITADYISTKIASLSSLSVNAVNGNSAGFDSVYGGNIYFRSSSGSGYATSNIKDIFLSSIEIRGPVNNVYSLYQHTANDANGVLVGTFSRATSLSGAWSGGTITVTASPQGSTYTSKLQILSPDGNVSKSGKSVSRKFVLYHGSDETHTSSTGFSQTISIDASSVWNDGYDDARGKITWPSALSAGVESTSFVVKIPNSSRDGKQDVTFSMTKGTPSSSGGYVAVSRGAETVGRISISNWYKAGYDAREPRSGTAGGRTSGVASLTHDFTIKSADGSEKNVSILVKDIYDAARAGYTADSKIEAEKEVPGSVAARTISPSSGYVAMKKVKVAAPSITLSPGSWSGGVITVTATGGAQTSITLPQVASTTWENTTGNTWRTKLSIGGVNRYSDAKDFQYLYDAGSSAGYSSGYSNGYSAGDSAGYNRGYGEGNSAGYNSGYSAGDSAGYSRGWNEGIASLHVSGIARSDSYASSSQETLSTLDTNKTYHYRVGVRDGNDSMKFTYYFSIPVNVSSGSTEAHHTSVEFTRGAAADPGGNAYTYSATIGNNITGGKSKVKFWI